MNNELRDIAAALEKIQKDIRSIAETLHEKGIVKEQDIVKHEKYQDSDLLIERVKKYYANGLSNAQIADLFDVDYWIVRNITSALKKEEEHNE